MNQSEQLTYLKGTEEQKRELMNSFLNKLLEGQELPDAELAMFEFLRAYFLEKPIVANMSATVHGQGSM